MDPFVKSIDDNTIHIFSINTNLQQLLRICADAKKMCQLIWQNLLD